MNTRRSMRQEFSAIEGKVPQIWVHRIYVALCLDPWFRPEWTLDCNLTPWWFHFIICEAETSFSPINRVRVSNSIIDRNLPCKLKSVGTTSFPSLWHSGSRWCQRQWTSPWLDFYQKKNTNGFVFHHIFLLQLFCKSSLLLLGPVLDCLVHSLKEAQPRSHSGPRAAESLDGESMWACVCLTLSCEGGVRMLTLTHWLMCRKTEAQTWSDVPTHGERVPEPDTSPRFECLFFSLVYVAFNKASLSK